MSCVGITRRSALELARNWKESTSNPARVTVSERWLTMGEVKKAAQEGLLAEAFGTGTAAVVSPVNGIVYNNEEIRIPTGPEGTPGPIATRLWRELSDIYYGRTEHPWSIVV
jgi:branched-chain amino acid aminotransferase